MFGFVLTTIPFLPTRDIKRYRDATGRVMGWILEHRGENIIAEWSSIISGSVMVSRNGGAFLRLWKNKERTVVKVSLMVRTHKDDPSGEPWWVCLRKDYLPSMLP